MGRFEIVGIVGMVGVFCEYPLLCWLVVFNDCWLFRGQAEVVVGGVPLEGGFGVLLGLSQIIAF
jgi:hypothetical protein